MSKSFVFATLVLLLSSCGAEVVIGDEEPGSEETLPELAPSVGAPPETRPWPPAEASARPERFCYKGQVFFCTLPDGQSGIQVCIDGLELTECSNESPVPHP